MSLVIGCGTHLGKQQSNFPHLRCCGIKKACARIQNKWTQRTWDDFEKALSKLKVPLPNSKERKKGTKNETEVHELSTQDLYLIAKEIIKIETPMDPKYYSMNTKIYSAYVAKKGPSDPDVNAWGSLKQQKSSKKQKKQPKEEPQTNVDTNVKMQSIALRTPPKSPTLPTLAHNPGGLALVEGFFLRSSISPNPSYPRPVIQFLEDILPEEIEYWECAEEELERAEVYLSAMESDEVEFKRGKFIVKELSVLEQLPEDESENANFLFGMPIEIVTGEGTTRAPVPSAPPQATPDQPSRPFKKSPSNNTPASQRTTRSRSAVTPSQQKEDAASPSPSKKQKLDKST